MSNTGFENSDINKPLEELLSNYYSVLDRQSAERENLINQIEGMISSVDRKQYPEMFSLLQELREQFLSKKARGKELSGQVKTSTSEIPLAFDGSDSEELVVLYDLIESKREEIAEKDEIIEELNAELELITSERQGLVDELEKLNNVIESWKNQLELLEKMAKIDPRYRILSSLRTHGKLTEIQLAFTLGTSILQIKRYVVDLLSMGLITSDPDGKLRLQK